MTVKHHPCIQRALDAARVEGGEITLAEESFREIIAALIAGDAVEREALALQLIALCHYFRDHRQKTVAVQCALLAASAINAEALKRQDAAAKARVEKEAKQLMAEPARPEAGRGLAPSLKMGTVGLRGGAHKSPKKPQ